MIARQAFARDMHNIRKPLLTRFVSYQGFAGPDKRFSRIETLLVQ